MTTSPLPLPIHLLTQKFINRFWSKVIKTDTCWIHTGKSTHTTIAKGIVVLNSRLVYYFYHKSDPYPFLVLHKCDVRNCVNPDHLFLGDISANHADMVTKNRQSKGSSRKTFLIESDIPNIRWLLANGYTHKSIAEHYSVSEPSIQGISKFRNWKHITDTLKPDWI